MCLHGVAVQVTVLPSPSAIHAAKRYERRGEQGACDNRGISSVQGRRGSPPEPADSKATDSAFQRRNRASVPRAAAAALPLAPETPPVWATRSRDSRAARKVP